MADQRAIYLSPTQRKLLGLMVAHPLTWPGHHTRRKTTTGVQAAGLRRTMRSLLKLGLVRWAVPGEPITVESGVSITITRGEYVATFQGTQLAKTLRLVKEARNP